MKTTQGVQAGVAGAKGGSSTSIPSSVVGVWGEMIGSSTDAITPDTITRKKLVYIKLIRTVTGDGDLMGNGSGGVAMSIAGNVVSVNDGANIATVTVTDFDAIDDQIILGIELNESARMRAFSDHGTRVATTTVTGADVGAETANLASAPSIQNNLGCVGAYNQTTHRISNSVSGTDGTFPRFHFDCGTNRIIGDVWRCEIVVSDHRPIERVILQNGGTATQLIRDGNRFFIECAMVDTWKYVSIFCRGTITFDAEIISMSMRKVDTATVSNDGLWYDASRGISCWGNSLVYGTDGTGANRGFPYILQYLLGRPVYNGGVAGETVTQVKTRMLADTSKYGDIVIIDASYNSRANPSLVISETALMVNALTTDDFLIIGAIPATTEWSGSANHTKINIINASFSESYGDRYIDLKSLLQENYNPLIAADLTDIGHDTPPTSLRALSDTLHPNRAGYMLEANAILSRIATVLRIDVYNKPSQFVYGNPIASTGTLTLTPIKHGDTAAPVADVNRVVQSTKELTGKQVEKYLTTATINAWRDENGKYIQVERT